MNNMLKIFSIITFALLISSCASIPEHIGYKGKDAAILYSGGTPNIFSALANNSATILFIDGIIANTSYLKPGRHRVIAQSNSMSIFSPLSAKITLDLDLKANRKYKITSTSSITKGLVTFLFFDITEQKEKLLREFHTRGYI